MRSGRINNKKSLIAGMNEQFRHLILASALLTIGPMMLFAQNHKLIIEDGATFSGSGTITVKDTVRNNNSLAATVIPGKLVLSGSDQQIVNSASNASLNVSTLSVRGSGSKTVGGTITVFDSLNILPGTTLDVRNDTLRIGNLIASSGTINSNSNSVMEYIAGSGTVQTLLGGTFPGKIRLMNAARKNIASVLTVDSLEHTGWGLTVNNNLTINGKAQIDSLIDVAGGMALSFGTGSGSVSALRGNDGIIQANAGTTLAFLNDAQNGTGTIRTNDGTVTFNGNAGGSGTLAITGSGTINFGGGVSSSVFAFAQNSTVNYNGSTQTVVNTNYGNLNLVNPGTKTFSAGTTSIAGSVTVTGGAAADALTNATTIDYNGSGAQTIGALNYYNLSISGDHGNQQISLANGDTVRVAGSFANSATNAVFISTNNTFEYNGTAAQTIVPFFYNNLVLSGNGSKSLIASQTASGNVLQRSGTALTVNSGVIWQIDGVLITDQNFVNGGEVIIGN
jgi:hypothetical protein